MTALSDGTLLAFGDGTLSADKVSAEAVQLLTCIHFNDIEVPSRMHVLGVLVSYY